MIARITFWNDAIPTFFPPNIALVIWVTIVVLLIVGLKRSN